MILRHLEYLVALEREQHFGRAAKACGVTQPTLSAAIKELEAELNVLIVERGQKYQGLTPEGERTLAWARRILADCAGLKQDVNDAQLSLSGRLVLGVIPTALASLGILTAAFREAHPDVRLTVLSMTSASIQRGLDSFELEAGITYLDNEPLQNVRSLPLYREHYFLVTGNTNLFPKRRHVSWSEVAQLPLCLLTPDMQNRRIVDAAVSDAGETLNPVIETNSILALYSYVRNDSVATVLTQTALHLLGRPNWLRALPVHQPELHRTIGLVYPDRDPQQPMTKAFVDVAKSQNIERMVAMV